MASHHHNAASTSPHMRLMCSFNGCILPRPHDNQLRYVGGDTRVLSLPRHPCSFSLLLSKLSKYITDPTVIKYQLPNEDLDALITLASDEDLENMLEEYDRLQSNGPTKSPRIRLFLFSESATASAASGGGFGSILSGSGSKHENWFVDALNGRPLERGRSEASSIVSEVPDYLFGLDANSSDEPVIAPQVESKPEISPVLEQESNQYMESPAWQYAPEPVQFYYVPGPVQGGNLNIPARPMQMQMPAYAQPVQRVACGQTPFGFGPAYGGSQMMMGGAYDYPGVIPVYRPAMGFPQGTGEAPGSPANKGSQ